MHYNSLLLLYSWVIHICDDGNIHLRGDIVFEDTKQYFVVKTRGFIYSCEAYFPRYAFVPLLLI